MDLALQGFGMVVNNSAYDDDENENGNDNDNDGDEMTCTVVDFGKKEVRDCLDTCEDSSSSSDFLASFDSNLNSNEEHVTSFDESSSPSSVDVIREKIDVEASHCEDSEQVLDRENLGKQGSAALSGTVFTNLYCLVSDLESAK